MMSVVGYPETDKFNKIPRYCSRCGRYLKSQSAMSEYDIYTGEEKDASFLSCPTLIETHDRWKMEAYGAWVNYKRD